MKKEQRREGLEYGERETERETRKEEPMMKGEKEWLRTERRKKANRK